MKEIFVFIALISCITGINAAAQDPKCLQPKEPGLCRMRLERYYYNKDTNTCEVFQYSGCRGNDNKFGFQKTCEDACVRKPSSASIGTNVAAIKGTTKSPVIRDQINTMKKSAIPNAKNQNT